jgi:hypothetical protein
LWTDRHAFGAVPKQPRRRFKGNVDREGERVASPSHWVGVRAGSAGTGAALPVEKKGGETDECLRVLDLVQTPRDV